MRESTVAVPTIRGRNEYLTVPASFVRTIGRRHYLPIAFVQRDREKNALVQLPCEADSGANRVWVAAENFQEAEEVAT